MIDQCFFFVCRILTPTQTMTTSQVHKNPLHSGDLVSSPGAEEADSIAEIRTKFESGKYEVVEAPNILQIDYSGVYEHKNGLVQNVIQSLERQQRWKEERMLNNKLKAHGYGEYDLSIGFINTKYFESRDEFDRLYSKEWTCSDNEGEEDLDYSGKYKIMDRISLEQALLYAFKITFSCDMEHYLSNREEMEQDLGRKLEELDVNDEALMKSMEADLFRKQVVKIFGEDWGNGDEETLQSGVTFNDFKVLHDDGNYMHASAIREDYYFIFYFVTS